jgi:hypothetical protein
MDHSVAIGTKWHEVILRVDFVDSARIGNRAKMVGVDEARSKGAIELLEVKSAA